MKVLAVIPARISSTRLAQKPLIKVAGKTILQHVYDNLSSSLIDQKIIATDSQQIQQEVNRFGGQSIMTSVDHKNGTERCLEVAKQFPEHDIVLNIQGDEPLVNHKVIEALLFGFHQSPQLKITTLKKKITLFEAREPNIVKVITDRQNHAIYFSRALIPHTANQSNDNPYFKHLGFYGFKRSFLHDYVHLPVSQLEEIEQLEQLRILYHGEKIYVQETQENLIDINVSADVKKFEQYLLGKN